MIYIKGTILYPAAFLPVEVLNLGLAMLPSCVGISLWVLLMQYSHLYNARLSSIFMSCHIKHSV